jgi:hypothetical protein
VADYFASSAIGFDIRPQADWRFAVNNSLLLLLVGLGVVVMIGLFIVAALWRVHTASGPDSQNQTRKYSEGYWLNMGIGLGLVMGMALGLPLGIAMDNIAIGIALGPALGLSIGVAIGTALQQKHRHETRPLTDSEQRTRSRAVLIGVIALALGVAAFALVLRII